MEYWVATCSARPRTWIKHAAATSRATRGRECQFRKARNNPTSHTMIAGEFATAPRMERNICIAAHSLWFLTFKWASWSGAQLARYMLRQLSGVSDEFRLQVNAALI